MSTALNEVKNESKTGSKDRTFDRMKDLSNEKKTGSKAGNASATKTFVSKGKKTVNSTKLETAYDIYRKHAITVGPYTGIPSIAARHTAIEYGSIQLDAGHVPREVAMNKLLVLITHFHTDHGSDICNFIGHGERVTVFVPAYCAFDLFIKIKCDMSMQKGRPYNDEEIVKMVRIIGCKRNNDLDKERFGTQNLIFSQTNSKLVIAELVTVGDVVKVPLRGREQVAIEPFACYHTVDTCGYIIYELNKRLTKTVVLEKNFSVDVNFTEDQPTRKKREKKLVESDEKSEINETGKIEPEYDWKKDQKFSDIVQFSERNNVEVYPEIVDEVKTAHFTLKVRRLHFPNGMNLLAKDDMESCVLSGPDFVFLKKYKIDVHEDHLTPKTMFFGDTGSYVFDPKTVGFNRLMEMLEEVETVIIESTFLETRKEMGEEKYKDRAEKRHMFLFELCDIFKKFPETKFMLIHFSACYDRETIKRYIEQTNKIYGNVTAFI